ncbi:MAG: leucine-rich repeat protein [Oscillospiraceae bacterium]|nr:leucine-rich repeat protein [Oscillospiraceae bacterium]
MKCQKKVEKIVPVALFGSMLVSSLSMFAFASAGKNQNLTADYIGFRNFIKKTEERTANIQKNDQEKDLEYLENLENSERKRKKMFCEGDEEDQYQTKRALLDQNQDTKMEEEAKEKEIDELYNLGDDDEETITVTKTALGFYIGGGFRFKIVNERSGPDELFRIYKKAILIGIDTKHYKIDKDVNKSLKEINISRVKHDNIEYDVTDVSATAFFRCVNLEKIILPNVKKIDNGAFLNCQKLEVIKLPNLEKLGSDNFLKCPNLREVELSCALFADGIGGYFRKNVIFNFVDTYIEDYKLQKNKKYKNLIYRLNHKKRTVDIIEDIEDAEEETCIVGNNEISKCDEVNIYGVKYKVVDIMSYGYIRDNFVYELNHTQKTADIVDVVDKSKITGNLNISGIININKIDYTVKKIAPCLLSECENLIQVNIGDGIEDLGDNVFKNCVKLKNIVLPNSLRTVGSEVFWNCGLDKIVLPITTTDKTKKEWYYWDSEVGIENLVDGAIIKDESKDINYISSSFTSRFYRKIIDGLKYNTTSDGAVIIGYDEKTVSKNIVVPEKVIIDGIEYDVVEIGEEAFSTCNKITSLSIPSSVKKIGSFAFFACECLNSVKMSEGIETIEENAFQDCVFKYFEIPDSVVYLGQEAFLGCCNLKNIKIGSGLDKLLFQTFGECPELDNIVIPKNIKFIDKTVFASDLQPSVKFTIGYKNGQRLCQKIIFL